jgi:hypothetical protein
MSGRYVQVTRDAQLVLTNAFNAGEPLEPWVAAMTRECVMCLGHFLSPADVAFCPGCNAQGPEPVEPYERAWWLRVLRWLAKL